VSLNLRDVEVGGVFQAGCKAGTAGHPLPGVAVKIVEPQSGRKLDVGEEGLLLVKGPNVMLGYLQNEHETNNVISDGWYNTGDVARVDEDGFLTITGRLSRFSKIAGEMVPHAVLEQCYHEALGTDKQLVAVTSVPNEQKGEELVVLYAEGAGDADALHEIINNSSLPNIWRPRRDNYVRVESIPLLGSGKPDLVRLKEMALAAKKGP
jgi:acyl-[acyl-carrier-protein]-phospholipid O-acyltransferase/long-chain-fatty-acid--[acyl-carrier-protein] ligase